MTETGDSCEESWFRYVKTGEDDHLLSLYYDSFSAGYIISKADWIVHRMAHFGMMLHSLGVISLTA